MLSKVACFNQWNLDLILVVFFPVQNPDPNNEQVILEVLAAILHLYCYIVVKSHK
jgi:hypothetical protein